MFLYSAGAKKISINVETFVQNLIKYTVMRILIRASMRQNYDVACPKFGHSALGSKFYNYALNTAFVADEGNRHCYNEKK